MLKYYGTPITPKEVFDAALSGRNCLIPFPRPDNLKIAKDRCNKIIIDNGAFTIWNQGGSIDWNEYYKFIEKHIDDIEFFFIPDVINGTEEENDELIANYINEYKHKYHNDFEMNKLLRKGVPIWHVNESIDRLERLIDKFRYIAIGSAGKFRQLGTPQWHSKMDKAMRKICDKDGYPKVKVHMLRCLDPKIFTQYPFYSGDSTSLAQNHKRDGWQHIVNRIERYNSPEKYEFRNFYEQKTLFEEVA